MPYKVLKPIPNGDGTYHQTGDIVPAEGWRNLRQLINGRYLVEVLEAAQPAEDDSDKPAARKKRSRTSSDEA